MDVGLGQLKEVFESARVKPAVVQVESHPYLPEWELLDYCKENGIVMQPFAPLGHGMEPKLLDDPVITAIAKRVRKPPAQVLLAWAVQRVTAPLTTATDTRYIEETFKSRLFPMTRSRKLVKGSRRGSGSIRL
jgi:diketogulonate reductase-like aldo/keto reductase